MKSGGSQGTRIFAANGEHEIFTDEEHTITHPYCEDLGHGCHTNLSYHRFVMLGMHGPTEEDLVYAAEFFGYSFS